MTSTLPSTKPTVSAFIVCCNEEEQIRRCLESLVWCDEIVIIDSGSTDRTLDICREFTKTIFQRPWPGFVAQKRFGLEQCSSDWVLNIDADEVVTPELQKQIVEALGSDSVTCGYELSRIVFFLGQFWRKGGWYPEYRLRLCKRDKTTWGGEDPHEKALVDGPTKRLNGELLHFTYRDFSNQIRTLNSFSQTSAESMWKRGERASLGKILLNPLARFFKFYLFKKGYREGIRGLFVALIEMFSVFLKYVKLWEKELTQKNSHDS